MRKTIAAVVVVLMAWGGAALDHSGGKDAYGCHTDHKTGVYHCH